LKGLCVTITCFLSHGFHEVTLLRAYICYS